MIQNGEYYTTDRRKNSNNNEIINAITGEQKNTSDSEIKEE